MFASGVLRPSLCTGHINRKLFVVGSVIETVFVYFYNMAFFVVAFHVTSCMFVSDEDE